MNLIKTRGEKARPTTLKIEHRNIGAKEAGNIGVDFCSPIMEKRNTRSKDNGQRTCNIQNYTRQGNR